MPVIKMRYYQDEALKALDQGRRDGKRKQLVVLPTGSGKTIVAAEDIRRVVTKTGKGAVFMAHRDELITQPAQKIPLVWNDAEIGRVKAKDNELGRKVTVASVQTIQREKRLAQVIGAQEYSLLYIDEAHHATADSYRMIIDAFVEANPNIIIVGLTATPVRADGTRMSEVFADVTYQKSMLDLIEDGFLSDLELEQVPLDVSIDGIPRRAGDLKPAEVRRVVTRTDIMVAMVDAWKNRASSRRTIAFAVDVEHAHQLAQCFKSRGVKSDVIFGDMPQTDRRAKLDAFQRGKLDVLVNCMILTEGFDDIALDEAPPLSCIMLARPTLSQSLYIQQIGRGTRPDPMKDNCLILDFSYNSKRHHIIQLPHLFGLERLRGFEKKKKEEEDAEAQEKHIPSILAAVREAQKVDIRKPPPRAGFRWARSQYGFALSIGKEHGFMVIRPVDDDNPTEFDVYHFEPPREDLDESPSGNQFELVAPGDTPKPKANKKRRIPRSEEYAEHKLTSKPLSFDWAFGLAEDACRELHETRSKGRKMAKTKIIDRDADWLALPPTNQQLNVLARTGKKPKSRGEATNMITTMIIERIIRERVPATKKQLGFLRWKKIPFDKGITKSMASRLIGEWHKQQKEGQPQKGGT
jgi:superfamily II DNA or RNA helicase